jgi:hypothetical protein
MSYVVIVVPMVIVTREYANPCSTRASNPGKGKNAIYPADQFYGWLESILRLPETGARFLGRHARQGVLALDCARGSPWVTASWACHLQQTALRPIVKKRSCSH